MLLRSGIELPAGVRSVSADRRVSTAEVGRDGDSWYTGVRGGGPDVNPELTGSAKFAVYDEMLKTDSVVKSMVWAFMLPIRSAETEVDPAGENPIDRLAADYVAADLGVGDELGMMNLAWSDQQRQALGILPNGVQVEELIWGDIAEWRDADGDPHRFRPLVRLAPRPAKTIDKVDRDRFGRVQEITQNVAGAKPMPGDKVTYMTFEDEPGTWEGVSLLRSAWGPWKLKRELMVAAGIAFDRFSSGVPALWYPAGSEANKQKAEEMGREYRAHERAYFAFEGARGDGGWDMDILSGATSIADPVPLLRGYNLEILFAGMQAFMALGITESGSRAVGNVQQRPYYEAVDSVNHYIARERTRQVAQRIKTVNFGAAVDTPRIRTAHIHTIDPEKLAAIADLAPYFNFTDRDTQDDVRDYLGLQHLPEDDLAERGIDPAVVREVLRDAGLDPETLAGIVNQLPEEVGVEPTRNGRPEGEGLAA